MWFNTWWAAVSGVTQSRTQLKRLSSSSNLFPWFRYMISVSAAPPALLIEWGLLLTRPFRLSHPRTIFLCFFPTRNQIPYVWKIIILKGKEKWCISLQFYVPFEVYCQLLSWEWAGLVKTCTHVCFGHVISRILVPVIQPLVSLWMHFITWLKELRGCN